MNDWQPAQYLRRVPYKVQRDVPGAQPVTQSAISLEQVAMGTVRHWAKRPTKRCRKSAVVLSLCSLSGFLPKLQTTHSLQYVCIQQRTVSCVGSGVEHAKDENTALLYLHLQSADQDSCLGT